MLRAASLGISPGFSKNSARLRSAYARNRNWKGPWEAPEPEQAVGAGLAVNSNDSSTVRGIGLQAEIAFLLLLDPGKIHPVRTDISLTVTDVHDGLSIPRIVLDEDPELTLSGVVQAPPSRQTAPPVQAPVLPLVLLPEESYKSPHNRDFLPDAASPPGSGNRPLTLWLPHLQAVSQHRPHRKNACPWIEAHSF